MVAICGGVLGDRYGRKSCLFASILTYSVATLYCSTVDTVQQYTIARFIAGFGVAGELGIGLTLISERLVPERRGYGAGIFIILGFGGVLLAATASEYTTWRIANLIGGIAGLVLLAARVLVMESGLYSNMAARVAKRGGLKIILRNPALRTKYIAAILLLTPATFTPQILWTLSPELAKAQGIAEPVKASITLFIGYSCVMLGDLFAILLSEKIRSRKKAILVSYTLGVVFFLKYILFPPTSTVEFYIMNGLLGLVFGVWVVSASLIAEQFGTNIRSTAVTTIPNFGRAMTIPMNLTFGYFKAGHNPMMIVTIIGCIVFTAALWGWRHLEETYGKDLNYEDR